MSKAYYVGKFGIKEKDKKLNYPDLENIDNLVNQYTDKFLNLEVNL